MNNPSRKNTIYTPPRCLILDNIAIDGSTGCWEWTGNKGSSGYGRKYHRGRRWETHRLSYLVFVGEIEAGLFICHRCDNPGCVNPTHLFIGTHKDNMADMKRKGRCATGEDNGLSKLMLRNVVAIKAAYYARDHNITELATIYGVHDSTISRILNGERWVHAGGPLGRCP